MNNPFEIKVCGINDEMSMNTALKCKADYVGLVFYPNSPRNVSINLSRELLQLRNKITKIVALIVDPYDDFLFEIKKKIKPDYIQLHGNEDPNRCMDIKKKFNIPIIKGVNVKNKLNLIQSTSDFEDICDILLLDAPSEALPGGNGKKFDWDILKDFKSKKKWMLAGGLNIENIEKAIDITKAPAIDISSGLEIMKGVKDPRLIENFIIKCKEL
jgi:phosphoribosylanthranilate isomerase